MKRKRTARASRSTTNDVIGKYMTPAPDTIEPDATVHEALGRMREENIRHLPVEAEGKLVGVVSERALEAATLSEWADKLLVSDVMRRDPCFVNVDAPLSEALDLMIENKFGSVLVKDVDGELAGIFTTHDALQVLRAKLPERRGRGKSRRAPLRRAA